MKVPPPLLALPLLVAPSAGGCTGGPDFEQMLKALPPETVSQEWHVGPDVVVAPTGPARFAEALYASFSSEAAMKVVEQIDGHYRAPANRGYDAVLDHLVEALRGAGFGGDDDRLLLEMLSEEPGPAWTPVSGSLTLLADGEEPRTLHAFDSPEDVDRVMLPIHAPSCEVEGLVALNLDEVKQGMILVTDVAASQVIQRAKSRGAAAVVSASLADFNRDPSGAERHLDAIQFRTLHPANAMPVAQISRNTLLAIEAAVERANLRKRSVRLRFEADVLVEQRPLRTLVATIVGAERPDEAVAMVSHVQEPGACDNATGVAGLLEGALGLRRALARGDLDWPAASLVFIWGDEFAQTEAWLEDTLMKPLAGISSDMTGQSKDTGAIALLERMPDPGAVKTLPPDAHSAWGAGDVDSDALDPNGFAIIARCAMVDVGLLEDEPWPSADHPWEGGSDHDIFNRRGVPAVLFWHFTDFTYHTSLDRMEFVDPAEIRRTTVAILATALAVADPEPADLERYLGSLDIERRVRVDAAADVEDRQLEVLWALWCEGARNWLRKLCLGIDEDLPQVEHR